VRASYWLARCRGHDIVIVSALLIAGWKYTSGIRKILDIGLWDETIYLTQGIDFLHFALSSPESAPLYGIWYSLLARVSTDPIALYYLNYRMVTIFPPVLFYILLRRYHVSLLTSSLSALFLLLTSANFFVWPKVNHFAIMVLLVFLILAAIPKSWALGFAILAFGCLLAAYVRPEMFFAFVLCFAISVGLFLFRERTLLHAAALGSLALSAIAFGVYVGHPLSGQRSLVAFSQHFSLNWQAWTHDASLSPWDDSQQIVQMNFGQVSGIGQAVLHNPAAFAHHVVTNAINLPRVLVSTFEIPRNFFAAFHMRPVEVYILLALGIGGLLFLGRKTILPRLRLAIRTEKRFLLFVCAVCPVIILSCLIIYPRSHYIFVLGTLLLAVPAILLDPLKDRQVNWSHTVVTALCALVIVVITPNLANLPGTPRQPQPILEAVQFIRTLDITAETRLLSSDFGYTSYVVGNWGKPCSTLGCGNWKAVPSYQKSAWDPNDPGKFVPFDDFRRNEKINIILVTDDLLNDTRFRGDAEWNAFLENPESVGFVKLVLPDGKRALYVDRTILRSAK
jgi:hypothetical protein